MDLSGINQALEKLAHAISPTDPAHTWVEVADVVSLRDGTRTIVSRCSGCNQDKWVPK